MKMPKYILRVAAQEFAVPDSNGIATLIKIMEDAIPVHAKLGKGEIELTHTKDADNYQAVLVYLREVTITKIPAGVVWKRQMPDGTTEKLRPVPIADRKRPVVKRPALRGREPLQLEFGT
jgi:hypothetical protein